MLCIAPGLPAFSAAMSRFQRRDQPFGQRDQAFDARGVLVAASLMAPPPVAAPPDA